LSIGSYKGGSYKGLDLTFGKPGVVFLFLRFIIFLLIFLFSQSSCPGIIFLPFSS
jgi:hypothetical protein